MNNQDITIKGKGFTATYTEGAHYNWIIFDAVKKESTGFYNLTRGWSNGDEAFHPLGDVGYTVERMQDLINLCKACKEKERELKS